MAKWRSAKLASGHIQLRMLIGSTLRNLSAVLSIRRFGGWASRTDLRTALTTFGSSALPYGNRIPFSALSALNPFDMLPIAPRPGTGLLRVLHCPCILPLQAIPFNTKDAPRVRHTYVYVNFTPCNHLMPEFQAGAMTEHTTQRQDYGWGLSTQQIPWTQCETRKGFRGPPRESVHHPHKSHLWNPDRTGERHLR